MKGAREMTQTVKCKYKDPSSSPHKEPGVRAHASAGEAETGGT